MEQGRSGGLLRIIVGLVCSLVLFLVLGEIVVRSLDLVDRMNVYPRELYIATSHPDLPYRLRPGFEYEHADDRFALRVNSHGFRGVEIAESAQGRATRILVLGDSVVHGHLIAEPDTFPVRLGEAIGPDAGVEVLNGGVSGFNTAAELAFYESHLRDLKPDIVLLGVSLNDFDSAPVLTARGNLSQNPALRDGLPFLTNHSDFYLLLRWLLDGAGQRPGPMLRPVGVVQPSPTRDPGAGEEEVSKRQPGKLDKWVADQHQKFYADPSGPGWTSVRKSLLGFADVASRDGFAFVVVIFPEEYQVDTDSPNLSAQGHWLALCAEAGLDCFDLQPVFAEASAATRESLFGDTQHPNVAGIRVMSGAVAGALRDRGLLPADSPSD